jgi:hypothetical protein
MSEKNSIPVEHQDVPQAHQGLHQFLYSSDQEHEVVNPLIESNHIDTGDLFIALIAWQNKINESKTKIAAVYAIAKFMDQLSPIKFIGIARDLGSEIELLKNSNMHEGSQMQWQIKVHVFKFPKREQMVELRDRWLSELAYIPIGNQAGSEWNIAKSDKPMTLIERQAYEAKKLKLQTAMAIATEIPAPEDWSGLIAHQTEETLQPK